MGYIDEKGLERVLRTVKEYVDTSNKTVNWDDIINTPCHEAHNAVYIISAYRINAELALGYDPISLCIWNTNTGEVVRTGGDQIVEFNCTNGEVLKLQCLYQYYPDADSMDWHILPIQPVYESTDEICFGWYNVKTLDEKYIPDTIARQKELTELSAEVSGLSEGIALRNVGAEDTDESVEEPEIGGGGGMTTPSGDPMHYMFEAVGAEWNGTGADIERQGVYGDTITHKAGYWYLNELGDITTEEMRRIYLYANLDNGAKGITKYLAGIETRTNIATWSSSWNGKIKDQEAFAYAYNIIVARMRNTEHYIDTNASFAFTGCTALQKILPTLDATSTTTFNGIFDNCNNLREVRIKNIKVAIKLDKSPLISKASILYLIQNSAATSAMVITLHADAYARAIADAEIQAALEAHPNVSLASA